MTETASQGSRRPATAARDIARAKGAATADRRPVTESHVVAAYGAGMRLDAYLCRYVGGTRSRSEWQRLMEEGAVTLNGAITKPAARLAGGERVDVRERPAQPVLDPDPGVVFEVMYTDPAMVVVDKPAGLVVHPAPGHETGTLVHGLLARFPELRDPTGELRPGIVHRLDKDTSGLMVVGRTVEAIAALQRAMQRGDVKKTYRLLLLGAIQEEQGIIDVPIARDRTNRQRMAVRADGRPSTTEFRVLERLGIYTFVEAHLPSGRTHQLRVHFAYIGHPVAGDRTYGSGRAPAGLARQFVHSYELTVPSPADGQARTFRSELPADLREALLSLQPGRLTDAGPTEPEPDDPTGLTLGDRIDEQVGRIPSIPSLPRGGGSGRGGALHDPGNGATA